MAGKASMIVSAISLMRTLSQKHDPRAIVSDPDCGASSQGMGLSASQYPMQPQFVVRPSALAASMAGEQ